MKDILSARQAAKVIGCSAQKVRVRIERNIWKFGRVVHAKEAGREVNAYEIPKRSLARFLEIDIEEVDRRLNG